MKRIVKWGLTGAGVLCGLAVATMIMTILLVDPSVYRDRVATLVKEQTGRELTMAGDIRLSFFPWLGFRIGAVELGNAPGFGNQHFARIESAEARVKLLPLLRMQVEMDTIVLNGLDLHLERRANGSSNWDDLAGKAPAEEGTVTQAPPPEPTLSPEEMLAAVAINGIEVRDAAVQWHDEQSGQQLSLRHVTLTSGAIALGRPIPLAITTDFALKESLLAGHVELATRVGLELAQQRYRLDQLVLDTDLQGSAIPGGRLRLALKGDIAVDLAQQLLTLKALQLDTLGSKLGADVTVQQLLGEPNMAGKLSLAVNDGVSLLAPFAAELPEGMAPAALSGSQLQSGFRFSLADGSGALEGLTLKGMGLELALDARGRQLMSAPAAEGRMTFALKDGKAATALIAPLLPPELKREMLSGTTLAAGFNIDLGKAQTMQLAPLELSALGIDLKASLQGERILEKPQFKGELESGDFVPRTLLEAVGVALPPMADPNTLRKGQLATRFAANDDSVSLQQLALHLDDITLTGDASVSHFSAPQIRYQLSIDAIDADRYLPPPAEEPVAVEPPAGASAAAEREPELPLELMRGLDVDGTLKVGKLKVMNLQSHAIDATLKGEQGRFRLHPLAALLYDGSYQGDLRLDVSGKVAALAMDEHLEGIEAGPLLKDFLGEPYVSGKGSVAAKLTAQGLTPGRIKRTLNGNGDFRFEKGAVQGLNLGQTIRNAYALYKQQPKPQEENHETDFSDLMGSFSVKDGLVQTGDLAARTPLFRVAGKGGADLVKERIDMRLDTTVVSDLKNANNQSIDEFKGVTLPVTVKGGFDDPKVGLDVASVLKAKAQSAIDKKKAAAQAELEQRKAEAAAEVKRKKAEATAEAERKKQEAAAQARQRIEEEKRKAQQELEDKLKNMFKR